MAPSASLVSSTEITLITEAGLYFRGNDAIALSHHASVESLAAILWQADENSLFGEPAPPASKSWEQFRPSLASLSAIDRTIAMFPILEKESARSYDLSPVGFARTAAEVLRWYATMLVCAPRPSRQPVHVFVAKVLKAQPGIDGVIRQLLVLVADHEFDPITYAVRAAANVGVTPYQAVAVGLIASQGQRFQAERYGSTVRFLNEILAGKDGQLAVVRRMRTGETLPGFGRRAADPRTTAIMESLALVMGAAPAFKRLREAERTAYEAMGSRMDFIVPAIFVGRCLGLDGDELALSALGRMVGWIAHAMEQFHEHPLIRPRASYVGVLPPSGKIPPDATVQNT